LINQNKQDNVSSLMAHIQGSKMELHTTRDYTASQTTRVVVVAVARLAEVQEWA
jgi:hypothetical protein